LPEAQLDRFMFNVSVGYPSQAEEERIVLETTGATTPKLERALTAADIVELQGLVRRVPVAPHVVRYAVKLARASRPGEGAPAFVTNWVTWGAGPRASQFLVLGAKCRAVLGGRFAPGIDDVRAVAPMVLRHRIVTNFTAEAEGVRSDRVVSDLIAAVPADAE
jgi:MoxR-like ATPase